jgi:hypothetical protein
MPVPVATISTPRVAPAALERRFQAAVAAQSDIAEHLPLLRRLADECEHVTELGLRWANGSTLAFLAAQPSVVISWDISPRAIISQPVADLVVECEESRTSFQPRVGSSLDVILELTDLLFIDTYHVHRQLEAELTRHGERARKYLIFHDTATFGRVGEDGTTPGLRAAIQDFQMNHFPLWRVHTDTDACNGLIVLVRA